MYPPNSKSPHFYAVSAYIWIHIRENICTLVLSVHAFVTFKLIDHHEMTHTLKIIQILINPNQCINGEDCKSAQERLEFSADA